VDNLLERRPRPDGRERHQYAEEGGIDMTPEELIQCAKESIASGGPPLPWKTVGMTSIRAGDGQEMLFEATHDGKPTGWINDWTRQRICDAVNLLPLLVEEIERLRKATQS
jgi:hypothetical protein